MADAHLKASSPERPLSFHPVGFPAGSAQPSRRCEEGSQDDHQYLITSLCVRRSTHV
jgi:hypothetical protein